MGLMALFRKTDADRQDDQFPEAVVSEPGMTEAFDRPMEVLDELPPFDEITVKELRQLADSYTIAIPAAFRTKNDIYKHISSVVYGG